MIEDTTRRALDLVEELRAEIDFEIDDVIADILRDLPDEYFQRLRRSDQLKHLKTLLAISICQLDNQISLRSKDDRHIAVIGRQDYPGLLAKIVKRLPSEEPLIAAQIFTSKAHKFIIDLFEFEVPNPNGINDKAMVDLRTKTLDSGTAHVIEDGIDVVVTIPKKVDWDQDELTKSVEAVQSWGEDPGEYVTTKLSVSETAYKAWPNAIKKIFQPARTMAPGKPKFAFKKPAQKAGTF